MLGRLGCVAVGSRRLRAVFRAQGGHSWLDHGRPSAVHAAVTAAARLVALPLRADPRTTLNVGRIEGGEGVNVIAPRAELVLDLRSLEPGELYRLEEKVRNVLRRSAGESGVGLELEDLGSRPAGSIPRGHPLVEVCAAALTHLGLRPQPTAGSTDANLPLSLGIPSLALGITRGEGMHTQGEWIETEPMRLGVKQLVLVCAALAGAG
jgi:acetylornithine deacetylase/succinyl-diaminopimelate desuccinylase-like protein